MKASARMTANKAEAETKNGHRVLILFKCWVSHTEHKSINAFPWLGYMNKYVNLSCLFCKAKLSSVSYSKELKPAQTRRKCQKVSLSICVCGGEGGRQLNRIVQTLSNV